MADLFSDVKLINKNPTENQNRDLNTQDNDTSNITASDGLAGKVVCLFFSAAWCTPCQHFVPMLKEVYTELRQRGEALEVIFVSFDKSEEEMMAYYQHKHGDWLALKYGDPIRDMLVEKYNIRLVPKLVVIQPSGDVITSKGRKDIQDKGLVCMRAWQAGMVVKGERHETAEAADTQQEQQPENSVS